MKIKILTVCNGFVECEIPDDFKFLRVTLMTGDEIIEVYREDPHWGDAYLYDTLDVARESRLKDFFDAAYIVYPDQLETWNERKCSYNIWEKDKFKATFKGYVSA